MAATPSTMLELGTLAPAFSLPDVASKRTISLDSFAGGKALLVMFICHHCPFVKHIKDELARLGTDYANRDLAIAAISSNDPAVSAEDSPEGLKRMVEDWGLPYPVLYDESQAVATSYAAACTPDFFLFDAARRLIYRGQLDDSRPGNGKPVTGADLRAAIDSALAGRPNRLAPEAKPRLQYQMAAGQRARILWRGRQRVNEPEGRIVLVRHGETEANRLRRFGESEDIPLTEEGRRQAREVAVRLAREFRPELLVSSQFVRARQTSEIIGAVLGLATEIVAGLHEREFGCLKGHPYERAFEMMREDPLYDPARPWLWTPAEGEHLEDVGLRAMAALELVRSRQARDTVVVCHGAVIQAVTAHITADWPEAKVPANCGFAVVEYAKGEIRPARIY